MKARLTPTFVQKATAEPGAERTVYWDETMPGFGLVCTKAGHLSFVYQYRAGHRSRRMTFPLALGLDKARKEAKKALGGVAAGGDPLQERRKAEAMAENTLQSICEEYLRRDGKRLRTKGQIEQTLRRLVYPQSWVPARSTASCVPRLCAFSTKSRMSTGQGWQTIRSPTSAKS